jgi:hypothetical protein
MYITEALPIFLAGAIFGVAVTLWRTFALIRETVIVTQRAHFHKK